MSHSSSSSSSSPTSQRQNNQNQPSTLPPPSTSQIHALFGANVPHTRRIRRGNEIWRRMRETGGDDMHDADSEEVEENIFQNDENLQREANAPQQQGATRQAFAAPLQHLQRPQRNFATPAAPSDMHSESSTHSEQGPSRAELRRRVINATLNRGSRNAPHSQNSTTSRTASRTADPLMQSSTRPQRTLPTRTERVIQDGRLIRKNPQYLIGKRSNDVFINKQNLFTDSFGKIDPEQYFGQVFTNQEQRDAFFLEFSEDGSSMVSGTTSSTLSDEYSDTMSTATPTSYTTATTTEEAFAPLVPIVKPRVHAVPLEPIRSILQRPQDSTSPVSGAVKQTRFADDISHDMGALVLTHPGAGTEPASPEDSSARSPPHTPDTRPARQEITTPQDALTAETLFTRPTNLTQTPDLSSPPLPTVSFNMDDLASSPGDRSSSFHSIPAQVPYSPDLGALGESVDKTTVDTTRMGTTTDADQTTAASLSASDDTSMREESKKSPRTASLLRTPSDDEDSLSTTSRKRKRDHGPRPPATMEFGIAPPPPMDNQGADDFSMNDSFAGAGRLGGINESTLLGDFPEKFLGGHVRQLDETAQIDPRKIVRPSNDDDDSMQDDTAQLDNSEVHITSSHIYKQIPRRRPDYRDPRPDADDFDAEYFERHNDESDDETYEEPNSVVDIPDTVRRSNRLRLPPLRKWMNERADLEHEEIIIPREPEPKRRRIVPARRSVVDDKEGKFMVRSGDKYERKFVAATKEMIRKRMNTYEYETDGMMPTTDTGSGKLSVCTIFSKNSMKAGTLVMHPECVKAKRNSGGYQQVYTVLTGTVEVELEPESPNTEAFKATKGTMFYIPPHNDFLLRNPSKKVLVAMSYVMTRVGGGSRAADKE